MDPHSETRPVLFDIDAVLFDLDGVLTPTADAHRRAWKRLFDGVFVGAWGAARFDDDDYYRYVDGRPRYDGVRAVLDARGRWLPPGTPDDPADAATVCGLATRKDAFFQQELAGGIAPYPGVIGLLDALADAGTSVAVVSSSCNARAVLRAAGIAARLPTVVDGTAGLPGKPAPDTFLAAAALLGVAPGRAAIVEDALCGVAAGRVGGFGLVVGVDRGAGHDALHAAGADIVVKETAELIAWFGSAWLGSDSPDA
jgi:HAD superfamily hydrolase (TIGR01509 family)